MSVHETPGTAKQLPDIDDKTGEAVLLRTGAEKDAVPRRPAGKTIADLTRLRPTQCAVGFVYVAAKMEATRRHGKDQSDAAVQRFMRRHRLKTIAGPGGDLYIVDHHHWARAWLELGYECAPVKVVRHFSHLDGRAFMKRMRRDGYLHPYDENGDRIRATALPPTVMTMRDDPYRSLAAYVRDAGAYRKPGTAYGEFCWTGFLRDRIKQDLRSIAGFGLALAESIRLARCAKARKLPGYCGTEKRARK